MKFSKYLLASAIIASLGSTAVNAADGTITFNGLVTASACTAIANVTTLDGTFQGPAPITATLTLPPVAASSLNLLAGTYAGQVPFSITLDGCLQATGLNNVRVLFTTASSPTGDPNVMANTAAITPAADVAVAILQSNGNTQIDLNGGSALDPGATLPTGTAAPLTLNYMAAYKSLSTSVTPGNVTGKADFVISYF